MSSETIPEWAEKAAQDFHDKWETGMSGAAFRDLVRALLAAEQRGLEKAAERLPDEIDLYQALKRAGLRKRSDIARFIAAAIRSLGDKT